MVGSQRAPCWSTAQRGQQPKQAAPAGVAISPGVRHSAGSTRQSLLGPPPTDEDQVCNNADEVQHDERQEISPGSRSAALQTVVVAAAVLSGCAIALANEVHRHGKKPDGTIRT